MFWKISPKNPKLFNLFPFGSKISSRRVKDWSASYLLQGPFAKNYWYLLVMGPGQKFLTLVGLGRVSHLWFGFEFGKFPLKKSIFQFSFSSGQKKSRQVRKYPGLRRVGLLFTASQK